MSAEELKALGNTHFANKEFKEAIEAYTDAIDLDISNPVLYSNRSAAHLGNGNAKAALRDAEDSLAIDESYTKAFLRKSKALSALGRPAHAEQALKSGLEKFPDDAILKQGLKDFLLEEDGDQSILRGHLPGSPAQNMRDFQSAEGMRLGTQQALDALPHEGFKYAWIGDLEKFKETFDPVKHSKIRPWKLKLPLTTLIVAAAQRMITYPGGHCSQFEEILRLILERGWCRVDARDLGGYTSLGHATMHHPRLELAKILLEHGADPSSKTRFGSTPLFGAIMAQEVEATKLLLDAGSDPRAVDYDGATVEQMALIASPKILAMLHEAMNVNQQNKGIAPGGNCFNPSCGKPAAKRRCSECRVAIYCNRDCQRQAWKEHKKVCGKGGGFDDDASGSGGGGGDSGGPGGKEGRLRLKIFDTRGMESVTIPTSAITEMINRSSGMREGGNMSAAEFESRAYKYNSTNATGVKDENMVIKVQVPLRLFPGQHNLMLLYNKSRSFQAHCDASSGTGRELAQLIKNKGVQKAKGYFLGFMEKKGELTLLIDRMLPAQPW